MQIFIIKQANVKSLNVTRKHVTKGIQRIEDMDTPVNFRQNIYTTKEEQRATEKK